MIAPLAAEHATVLVALEAQARSGVSAALLTEALEASQSRVLGAWQGEALVGYALVARLPFEAELQAIAVLPERRQSGQGRALMDAVIATAKAWQSERLLLEVRAGNAAAIGLYQRHGFQEDGRRRHYYPAVQGTAGREDALLMSRALAAS